MIMFNISWFTTAFLTLSMLGFKTTRIGKLNRYSKGTCNESLHEHVKNVTSC